MKRLTMQNGDVEDDPADDRECEVCGGPMGDAYIRYDRGWFCSYECYSEAMPDTHGD